MWIQIEDECKLESEEQIAATVNQIFSFMNNGRLVNEAKGKFQAVQWQSLTMEEDPPFPPLFPIRKKEK